MADLTLAHVSDLHLPFEPQLSLRQHFSKRQLSVWSWRRRRHLQSGAILAALSQDLRDHAVDHVLLTGDITNFSLPGEFRQAANWLATLAPAERISLVPGNHDALVSVPDAEGSDLWAPWTRLSGEGWPYLHRVGDMAVIGLNSALPTAPLLARGCLGPLNKVPPQAGRGRSTSGSSCGFFDWVVRFPAGAGGFGEGLASARWLTSLRRWLSPPERVLMGCPSFK